MKGGQVVRRNRCKSFVMLMAFVAGMCITVPSGLEANAGVDVAAPPASFMGVRKQGSNWYLAGKHLAAAVDGKNGTITGIWSRVRAERMVAGAYLLYELQTTTAVKKTDERSDRVVRSRMQDGRLVLECVNPEMPGVSLTKAYWLEQVEDQQRILCRRLEITGEVKEKTLVVVTSRTLFDADYRAPSWYNRIFVIGTMSDSRSRVPAAEITERSIQRAWYNGTEGRAQFALVNPQTGTGMGEYLYLENDKWVFPQGLAQSYWTASGWDMSFAATFVKPRPYSAELRYHLFRGDHVAFHTEYCALPEYAAVLAEQRPLPKVARLAASLGMQGEHAVADNDATRMYIQDTAGSMGELLRPDELGLSAYMPWDSRWPDLPTGDEARLVFVDQNKSDEVRGQWSAKGVRDVVARTKQINPNLLAQSYHFFTDIYKGSQAYKEHRDWVVIKRDGTELKGFFGNRYVRANWSPAYVKYLTERLLATCDYLGLDICYLDSGVGEIVADWGRGEVIGFKDYLPFMKHLQAELHKRGKMLFLNSFVGQPYFDIGFMEGLGHSRNWGKTWRDWADVVMMTKFYYGYTGAPVAPLTWLGGDKFRGANEVPYINMVVASGLMPHACYLDPYQEHFPKKDEGAEWRAMWQDTVGVHHPTLSAFTADWKAIWQYTLGVHHACYEIRHSQWADIGLKPLWWEDLKTPLEVYTLRLNDTDDYLVNVISHEKSPADARLTVDLGKMGFDPAKRLFVWQFLLRDYAKYPKKVPVPENWNRLFSVRTCSSAIAGKEIFQYVIPKLPPERVCVTALTQTPAALASASGIRTQTLLPSILHCRITGDVDESARRVSLHVSCDKPVEVIAWWPKAWGAARAVTAGQELALKPESFGTEQFVRFALEKGQSDVVVTREE